MDFSNMKYSRCPRA